MLVFKNLTLRLLLSKCMFNFLSIAVSHMLTLTWGVNISCEKLTPKNRGLNLQPPPLCTLCLSGSGFHEKHAFFFI